MDTFQETIFKLKHYWSDRGAIIQEPYDVEVGAGTMCPETFLRVLGPKPYRVAYVQPSRRPADGRYGENPNRLYKHQQLQVILKPTPDDIIDQYLGSLEAIGIDLRALAAKRLFELTDQLFRDIGPDVINASLSHDVTHPICISAWNVEHALDVLVADQLHDRFADGFCRCKRASWSADCFD